MAYIKQIADSTNYGAKRSYNDVIAIVLHYTGNKGDTVQNNLDYFSSTKNIGASAHLFCDKTSWGKSVPLTRVAYAVGGDYGHNATYKGAFYGTLTNKNTVSIEICDFNKLPLNEKTLKNLALCIKHVLKYCPNVKYICRHYDVNGKDCPTAVTSVKGWSEILMQIVSYYNKGV